MIKLAKTSIYSKTDHSDH